VFRSIILPQQQAFKLQNNGKEIEGCSLWMESKKPQHVFALGSLKSHFTTSLILNSHVGSLVVM